MEQGSHHQKSNLGLFAVGLVVGAAVTAGLGTEEGKRTAHRLIESLKELVGQLNDLDSAAAEHNPTFPPPPSQSSEPII